MIELELNNIEFSSFDLSKADVFENFSKMAENLGYIQDKDAFKNGLFERESEFSTGIGSSIAIPHCKSNTIKEPFVLIQKFERPIEWEAIDGQPVKLAICLGVPSEAAGTTHLKLLSNIARSFVNKEFSAKVLGMDSKEDLVLAINEIINR